MSKKKAGRAANKAFPHSAAIRDSVLKKFEKGQTVHATLERRGKDEGVQGKVTRVARTGWLYVQLVGRSSPMKTDPTKWHVGPGAHKPKAAAKAKTTAKPRAKAPRKTKAASKKAPAEAAGVAAPAVAETPAAPKAKAPRPKKVKAPTPAAEAPKRTPVHVEEAPAAASVDSEVLA